ncbi:hypothetical protein AYI68_g6109, partial [Smittium mucronatum]
MGHFQGNAGFSLPGRFADSWGNQGSMHRKYSPGVLQAIGAWIPSQQGQVVNNSGTIYNTFKNVDQHQEARKLMNAEYEIMEVNRCPNGAGSLESIFLEDSPKRMEWALIPTRESGVGDIHRLQRLGLGDSSRTPKLLGDMDLIRGINAYQCQGAQDSIIRLKTQRIQGKSNTSILRQQYNSIVREEVWGDNITQTTRNFGRNLEALSGNEYQIASDLCPISIESSGCHKQADCSDRIFTVYGSFLEAELTERAPRRGSVCIPTEKEGEDLLHLVPGRQFSRSERTSLKLVRMEQPILLPTLELDIPGGSKTAQGADNNYFSHPNVEVGDMAPQPNSAVIIPADNNKCKN